MRHVVLLLALSILSPLTMAEEARPDGDLSSNVIGAREAPTVLNVVPWKDKEVKLEKKEASSSLLNRVLEPLDRDVLMREVEYYRLLSAGLDRTSSAPR